MNKVSNSEREVTGILFICMGNICRSPLAEGIFQHKLSECGLQDQYIVDSAGTGDWHAGDLADPRMRATALRHGIDLKSRARQVNMSDFVRFENKSKKNKSHNNKKRDGIKLASKTFFSYNMLKVTMSKKMCFKRWVFNFKEIVDGHF